MEIEKLGHTSLKMASEVKSEFKTLDSNLENNSKRKYEIERKDLQEAEKNSITTSCPSFLSPFVSFQSVLFFSNFITCDASASSHSGGEHAEAAGEIHPEREKRYLAMTRSGGQKSTKQLSRCSACIPYSFA